MRRWIKVLWASGVTLLVLNGCQQEKKTEQTPPTLENIPTASFSKPGYVLGDSVTLILSSPVSDLEISLDGKSLKKEGTVKDSLRVLLENQLPGWKEVIVKGKANGQKAFSDTVHVEFMSNIVPKEMKYSVITSFPHLTTSFTEGLEFHNGDLYESTGENGKSQLLKIDLKTGAALKSANLDQQYFGEGVTVVNNKIYQLTWQSGICFRYNMDFTPDKTFTYYFQGWGLTHKDSTMMMSDGSNTIHFYDTNFEKIGDLQVYDNRGPVRKINELEYVNGFIYANVFESTRILKIDAKTGKVVAYLNMDGMVPPSVNVKKDVLNGIAYNSLDRHFYLTGKNWPLLFKVKFPEM